MKRAKILMLKNQLEERRLVHLKMAKDAHERYWRENPDGEGSMDQTRNLGAADAYQVAINDLNKLLSD